MKGVEGSCRILIGMIALFWRDFGVLEHSVGLSGIFLRGGGGW